MRKGERERESRMREANSELRTAMQSVKAEMAGAEARDDRLIGPLIRSAQLPVARLGGRGSR